jgi:alkyl sulfatase BDS1-like metallo-beta-lactamase superfamily hydrolase
MNRNNRRRKNSRRFAFSNILKKDVMMERLEDRIVLAYVSGDFGWAASIESASVQAQNSELTTRSLTVDTVGNVYQVGYFTGTVDFRMVN